MVKKHKGFTIEVYREECLGGWDQVYYSVFRDIDGLEVTSGFTGGDEKIRYMINLLTEKIDSFIINDNENPEELDW